MRIVGGFLRSLIVESEVFFVFVFFFPSGLTRGFDCTTVQSPSPAEHSFGSEDTALTQNHSLLRPVRADQSEQTGLFRRGWGLKQQALKQNV